jgi:hypothetical protein
MKIDRNGLFAGSEIKRVKSFAMAPAVIAAFFDQIDLLEEILAHIGCIEASRRRIKAEAPHVAQPGGPDFRAHGCGIDLLAVMRCDTDEWIVRRHRVGAFMHRRMRIRRQAAGLLVHIDAQDRGVEAFVDEASVVEGIVRAAAIADADVKIAIGAEVQIAAVVIARGIELCDERLFLITLKARDTLMKLPPDPQAVIDEESGLLRAKSG